MNDFWYCTMPRNDMPMLENPPSWKRFCIVTFFVRSENITTQ